MFNKLSLPNKITIFRIALIPPFLAVLLHYRRIEEGQGEWLRYIALAVFAVATITDAVDGYVARKFHQRTELGAFLDPLADKLLLNCAVIAMCFRPIGEGYPAFGIPLWFAVVVFSRDLIQILGVLLAYMTMNFSFKIKIVVMGKIATILNMTAVIWILAGLKGGEFLYIPGGVCTAISGMQYIYSGFVQITESERKNSTQADDE